MIASSISIGTAIQVGVSVVIGAIIGLLGGWDTSLQTLLIFMLLDIITGMYVALIGKSHNSANGFYKSGVFGKGIFKKLLVLVTVSVAYGIDVIVHTDCLRDMTVVFFVINEAISILENASCAGVPIPNKLRYMLEVYHEECNGYVRKDDVGTDGLFPEPKLKPRYRLNPQYKKYEDRVDDEEPPKTEKP